MMMRQLQDEATAVLVLCVKRKTAPHELDDAAAKEESATKSIGEHVELGEFFKNEVGLVCRNTGARVFYGEEHGLVSGIDTHGDTALTGKVKGIEKQLSEHDEQMMAVGIDSDSISNMTVQAHLGSRSNQTAGIVKGLTD